jgi:hypothetical protein
MEEQTQEKVKIVNADEVVKYLETLVLYLESLQQDMITNINRINGDNDNA